MDLTLAPFGYLNSQKKLVDVYQVPSGKQCGCLCPSCHAPLIARKGKQKVWHFALDSKTTLFTALEKCSYSFYVSARIMALQLIGDRLSLTVPKYEITLSEYLSMLERHVQVSEKRPV
jgi:competence CoiA-like predicted nuclease